MNSSTFDIREHTDKLTPAGRGKGKNKFICPVCGGNDLGIQFKTGAYSCFNGCKTEDIREAVAPWGESKVKAERQRRKSKAEIDKDRELAVASKRIQMDAKALELFFQFEQGGLTRGEAIAEISTWAKEFGYDAYAAKLMLQDKLDEAKSVKEKSGKSSAVGVGQETRKHKLVQDYELIKGLLGDRLAFNTLKNLVELDGVPLEVETAKATLVIDHDLWLNSGKEDVADLVMKVAKQNQYNPIEQYLNQCYEKYGDDTSILTRFAERYFGQPDPIYTVFVIRFLIASVARIYQPGCKHDAALILQGGQGIRKSTFFKVLASEAWFDDSLGSVSDKDEKLKLHQTWFMEWAELETVFKRKDLSATKAFLSSATDRIRPPYGRSVVEMPRRCSIVGTTNQDEFLNDVTGNRRFWIIPVKVDCIDTSTLAEERDRIWAAAVSLYKAGEFWHLMQCEDEAAGEIAQQFQSEDPWLLPISQWLAGTVGTVTTSAILSNALQIETGKQDKTAQMRVADILKTLGWEKTQKRIDGKPQKVWTLSCNHRIHLEKEVDTNNKILKSTLSKYFEFSVSTVSTVPTLNQDSFQNQNNNQQFEEVIAKEAEKEFSHSNSVDTVGTVDTSQSQQCLQPYPPTVNQVDTRLAKVVTARSTTRESTLGVGSRVIDPLTKQEATITQIAHDDQGHPVCFLSGQVNEWRFLESLEEKQVIALRSSQLSLSFES